jgi:hypothetical protein
MTDHYLEKMYDKLLIRKRNGQAAILRIPKVSIDDLLGDEFRYMSDYGPADISRAAVERNANFPITEIQSILIGETPELNGDVGIATADYAFLKRVAGITNRNLELEYMLRLSVLAGISAELEKLFLAGEDVLSL